MIGRDVAFQLSKLAAQLKKAGPLFLAVVVVPTLAAALYFGVLASDVYISESRFVVRSPGKAQTSSLGAILSGAGIGGLGNIGTDETASVLEYIRSRDAVKDLQRGQLLSRAYAPSYIFWGDRFGGPLRQSTQEHLFQYYQDKVTIETDSVTGVTRLTVRAFSAADAHRINLRLIEQAEALVNRLNARSRRDTMVLAEGEVNTAKIRARDAAVALARYRNAKGLVDPDREAEIRLKMIAALQDEVIATRGRLAQLEAYTPGNPQIPAVRIQLNNLTRAIDEQSRGLAGGQKSLSTAAVQYQQFQVNSQVAEKQLAVALAALQDAQIEARKKHSYVERIAEPNWPDYPLEPRRWRGVLATFILCLLTWGIISTLLVGIREHRD